jgi:hypothetical protein
MASWGLINYLIEAKPDKFSEILKTYIKERQRNNVERSKRPNAFRKAFGMQPVMVEQNMEKYYIRKLRER